LKKDLKKQKHLGPHGIGERGPGGGCRNSSKMKMSAGEKTRKK